MAGAVVALSDSPHLSWTGLAMRVARYFPLVVVTGLVFQTSIPSAAQSVDGATSGMMEQPAELPLNGHYVDGAVQPANFYDSRPRSNSGMMPQPSAQAPKRSMLGNDVVPKSWFGRATQAPAQASRPVTVAPRVASGQPATPNAGQMRSRSNNQLNQLSSQPMNASRPTQQPVVNGRAMQPIALNNQGYHQGTTQPPIPIQQNAAARALPLPSRQSPAKPAPNSTPVAPWTTPAAAKAKAANPQAAAPAVKPAGPSTPADQLVAKAHQMSLTAKTEQEYSQIIETCRRAQASQISGESAKFASNLTAWSLNRRGQLKAEAGQEKEAILDFDDAIRSDSTCWRAVHNRGVLLAQAGQFEKAFDDFSRTIQLSPSFAKAYSNRAALFMVANNLEAAEQDYKKAVELDTNLAVAHRGYGRVCQLMNRLDDAVLHYDAAVQLAPNDGYAAACRADLLTDVGRYADALAEYSRALTIDPNSNQANAGSAWLLATCPDSALRDPELALERASRAIEFGGQDDPVSYDSLAAAQASAGDFESAMNSIQKAIELAPAEERDAYRDRQVVYQQAKPYRIAPVERLAQQASYQTK